MGGRSIGTGTGGTALRTRSCRLRRLGIAQAWSFQRDHRKNMVLAPWPPLDSVLVVLSSPCSPLLGFLSLGLASHLQRAPPGLHEHFDFKNLSATSTRSSCRTSNQDPAAAPQRSTVQTQFSVCVNVQSLVVATTLMGACSGFQGTGPGVSYDS